MYHCEGKKSSYFKLKDASDGLILTLVDIKILFKILKIGTIHNIE